MFGKVLVVFRILIFVLLTLAGLLFIGIVSILPGINKNRIALEGRRIWTKVICRILGMVVDSQGWEEKPVYILISNHRSYIDPVITLREARAFPLAKSEISRWPLIGYAAKYTGVIYVQRDNQKSRRGAVRAMETALESKFPVLVYPEGTTTGEKVTTDFKLGAFRIAAQNNMPIIPCAIDYEDKRAYWVNDDTFLGHFFRFFSLPRTKVVVRYGPTIQGDDPLDLLQRTQGWIDNELLLMSQQVTPQINRGQ